MIEAITRHADTVRSVEAEILEDVVVDDALPGAHHLIDHVADYVRRGKHVRSGLFLEAMNWWDDVDNDDRRVAASIEFLHSAMLIQDDIMDDDDVRRDALAMHKRFERTHEDSRTGESLAVCTSDILIFAAMEELGRQSAGASVGEAIRRVALGQFCDVTNHDPWNEGYTPSRDDIISLYEQKTGWYTFTLPLRLASKRSGKKSFDPEPVGSALGVVYQLRDDELNVFGDATNTGKPALSDVEEDKQTVLRRLLLNDQPSLSTYFGSVLTDEEKTSLREAFAEVKDKHTRILDSYIEEARNRVSKASLAQSHKDDLKALAEHLGKRCR